MELPYSEACERNKDPILKAIQKVIRPEHHSFLEVGHGTCQHAWYFSKALAPITYYAADQASYNAIFHLRKENEETPKNLYGPFSLEATDHRVLTDFKEEGVDIIFSANTLHIMSWPEACSLLKWMGQRVKPHGLILLYGPFKFEGQFTSESNERFDHSLKSREKTMGIRNFEDVLSQLKPHGVELSQVFDLPANNHLLVFKS